MKTAKAKGRKVTDRRTAEEIQRAFSTRAAEVAANHVFRPSFGWQVVAINVQTIDKLRLLDKDWDEIARDLRQASGFPGLAANSVRVYRSRLGTGWYDDELGPLGLCRVGDRIEPTRAVSPQAEVPDAISAVQLARQPTNPTGAEVNAGRHNQLQLPSEAVVEADHDGSAVSQNRGAGEGDHHQAQPPAVPTDTALLPASAGSIAENNTHVGASAPSDPNAGGSSPTSRTGSSARFTPKKQAI